MVTAFSVQIFDDNGFELIDNVVHFVGVDASGSFGILPNHCHFMTFLTTGLAKLKLLNNDWEYLALPSGLLHFKHNKMILSTRRYWKHSDYQSISRVLRENVQQEQHATEQLRSSLNKIEEAMLQRMWELKKHQG